MKLALIIVIIFATGCSKNIDEFIFKNTSDKDVYVKKVIGFSPSPPVGYLSSGNSAVSMFMDSKQVGKCEVIWGYQNKRDGGLPNSLVKSACNPIGIDLTNKEKITIIFNSQEQWGISESNDYRVDN